MADKEIKIENRDRVVKFGAALAHSSRISVLLAHANGGAASATALAEGGLDTLANVSYHQIKLLELGALRLAPSPPKEGVNEQRYDLTDLGAEIVKAAAKIGRNEL